MQPMVADAKITERRAFVTRLHKALESVHPDVRGRAGFLAKGLGVSTTMGQKYLKGEALPKGTRWKKLAELLKVNVTWLRDGLGGMDHTHDPLFGALQEIWDALPGDEVRRQIVKFAHYCLGEQTPPASKEPKRRQGS